MTTIAVTGASGFCGSYVAVTAAARGDDVLCVGRRPGPVGRHVPWDAACEVPDLSGADLVVHCAAAVGDPVPGSPAEAAMHAVNVDGTARLLEAAAGPAGGVGEQRQRLRTQPTFPDHRGTPGGRTPERLRPDQGGW
ncbi:NAD-dependent epimerase/dehydratase family protein [Streptomyces sp. NBC_01768]|uniref:NAD-dependent epimerase/dehydratase family protein n=1 Tax=Streptomyces sp. NBC_01768 TaxID=2975938 RepID=UPI002DDA75FA|nr:NAD(P)-dependent oxidoreductase [Streptomyces sp. NBC_01768]WSC32638.1 NAD(P)-dependent oxidoreductase [Streptomyces sp. NBC_01768]